MHSNDEVLSALTARLEPAGLAQALARILRVPAAWQKLHEPGFLSAVLAAPLPAEITPGHLASLALGGELTAPLGHPLASGWSEQSSQAWKEFLASPDGTRDLTQLALIGLEWIQQEDPVATLNLAQGSPKGSADVLAVAWLGHPHRERMMAELLSCGESGIGLACHAALANHSPEEAARRLSMAAPDPYRLIRWLDDHGEKVTAARLLELTPHAGSQEARDQLLQAERYVAGGNAEQARQALQTAWNSISGTAAEVADRMAILAQAQGDPVLAAEAARRAVQHVPTPERRAQHALCLLPLGKAQEARTCLDGSAPSAEEQVALGRALVALGRPDEGAAVLEEAADLAMRGRPMSDRWLEELAQALQEAGAAERALQVSLVRAERSPLHSEARAAAVVRLEAAGDPEGAAEQARLGLTLDPGSSELSLSLAKNLAASGQPAAALPHWARLVEAGSASRLELAACALAAGQVELAQAHCAALLEAEPDSGAAATLLARCHSAGGDHAAAEARLRELLAAHPEDPEARLALADVLSASGQDQAAGDLLFAAAQTTPHDPRVSLALSRWLRAQGRPSEAAQAAGQAVKDGSATAEALVEFGEASLELGDDESALQSFRSAVRIQPRSWQARLGVARALERQADTIQAGQHLMSLPNGSLPKSAPPDALVQAARIVILAAETSRETAWLPSAESHLQRAAVQLPGDPAVALWAGRVHEAAGRHSEALTTYQRCLARLAQSDGETYGNALLGIGRAAIAIGQLPLALSTLEQAQKRFPGSSEVQCLLSQAYASANLPEKAVQAAERAVEVNGRDPRAWQTLGRARAAVGDLERAWQAYAGLSSVQPEDAQGWLELAQLSHQAESIPFARKALAEALQRGRRRPQVLAQAAGLLEGIGAPRTALRALQASAALAPDDPATLTRMAELGEQLGKPEIAHRGWSRLAELDRKDPTALRKSADALWALGKSGEAVEAWRRSLDLQPQDPEAHRSLGRAYIQTGEVQQALNHYGAAVRLSPHDPSLPLEAGASAMRHGFLAEAAGLLAEAVERDPGSAQGWAGLGECRVQLGEWGEAELALSRAVDLMADSPRVAALQALTALAMGDHGSAMTWLSQAAGTKPAGLPDALWTARALLRMAHWGEAARILKDLTTTPDERAAGLAMGEIRVALLEARWAWAQAGADLSQLEAALRESSSGTAKPTRITDDLRLREQVLLRPGDQAALDALQSYVQRAQGGAAAQTLGIGLINAGQFETALKAVETLQPVTYGFDWRPLVQACALRRLDRTEAALEALEIGAQDPVLRPLAEALTAGIQAASGRRELAIAAWNRSLGARPQEPAWQHALAALYLEGGQWDQALPHLQQAVDQAPGAVSYRMQLAKALAACGHAVEAVASFKLAIDRGEPSRQELLEAGEAALAAEAAEVALDWFDRAQALAPDDPRGLVGSARAAMALGKVRKARERIEAALKAAPHDPAVRLGQGEILLQQRDYSGALQALSQARGLGGEGRARLIQTRSRARMALDQGEQAERELLVELEADPQNPALWFPLAKVRESRGEWAAAAEAAAQAVRLAPLNPEYRLGLAQVCRQSGNLDRALDELSRAREMAPSDPRLPLEQGRVHEERREFRRALEAYRKAIELDGRCMQAYYRSGLVLKQLKSYPQAGQMLKRAAELAPIDREVLHQLAAVRALELVHGPATGAVH